MKQTITWLCLLVVVLTYVAIVSVFPYEGPIALFIHFSRVAFVTAAFVMVVPMAPDLFKELPPPRIDRLFASVLFMLLSAECFSFLNEAHRQWPSVDNDVFTGRIAGLFSLFLTVGAAWVLSLSVGLQPVATERSKKVLVIAIVTGVLVSAGLVFIAPLFRIGD